jgi:hypothetical protein
MELPTLPNKTNYENVNIFSAIMNVHKRNSDTNIQYYYPNLIVESLFYIYLRKKYKSKCFSSELAIDALEIKISIDLNTALNKQYLDNIVKLNKVILDKIYTCIKDNQELIIIPIGIDILEGGQFTNGHANVLVYRRALHQLEHFEPHGSTYSPTNSKTVLYNEYISSCMKSMIFFINKNLLRDRLPLISYIPPNTVCPHIRGLQRLEGKSQLVKKEEEGNGYCLVWSFFFTELVLRNPTMTSTEIMEAVFHLLDSYGAEEKHDFLRRIARGYSHIINEKLQKYFKGASKTIQKMSIREISDKIQQINDVEFTHEINTHLIAKGKKFDKMSHSDDSPKKSCPEGKVLNRITNRCNKIKKMTKKVCPEGKFLNEKTNRCNKTKRVSSGKRKRISQSL